MTQINRQHRTKVLAFIRWACVIALFLSVGGYTYHISKLENPVYQDIYAQKGEKLVVLLSDGSKVWLNADSRLTYPNEFSHDNRCVRLAGEGYFEISKDSSRPFIVEADKMMIKVTGTKFNVKAYPKDDNITATLDEGKILIGKTDKKPQLQEMDPGETAIFNKISMKYNIKKTAYLNEASSWKTNKIIFHNGSLENVLDALSRKYNVEFTITNKRIKQYTYTVNLNSNNLESTIKTIETITPVRFNETSENKYEVK